MSGPHDHLMELTPLDQFDTTYTVYDNQYTGLPRTSDPSTPYEGFGFWYRPENQESIYNPDAAFPQQTRPIPPPTMDMPLALKHKRTRSGCFTCRQRRVKVGQVPLDLFFLLFWSDFASSAMRRNLFAIVSSPTKAFRRH